MTTPILKYPGAKWRAMATITRYIPPARRVVDLYCGSGAFALSLPHEPRHLVLNDRDDRIVGLFRVLRDPAQRQALCEAVALTPWSRAEYLTTTTPSADVVPTGDPVEDARRFLVLCWFNHGASLDSRGGWRHQGAKGRGSTYELWAQLPDRLLRVADRLLRAEIENLPALTLIGRYEADALLYADPPYPRRTEHGTRERFYRYEMTDDDHGELLTALLAHPGMVLISSYRNPIYDVSLADWHRVDFAATAEQGRARTESLWLNPACVAALPEFQTAQQGTLL